MSTHTSNLKQQWAARRRAVTPKTVNMSTEELVKVGLLKPGESLPLVVEPNLPNLSLSDWAKDNLDFIQSNLLKHGGILFRGFPLRDHLDLEHFLNSISLPLMHYMEGATPRTELTNKVYTSTEYPSNQSIALHNELNYVITWPMKILFFCVTPAEQGGETPIADVRKVYNLIDPKIIAQFVEKGWMLVRNFGDGMSLPWQTSFRMQETSELENYCRASRIECEWKDENKVRTRQVRPAVRRHPQTGEMLWFNHVAFWHISSLDPDVRDMFRTEFNPEELPYNTYFGDGTPIEDSIVEEIRGAYDQATVAFPWQKGDLLLLDNMLTAHGRNPFSGERKILAAMGEPYSDQASWNWSTKTGYLSNVSA